MVTVAQSQLIIVFHSAKMGRWSPVLYGHLSIKVTFAQSHG